MEHQRPFLYLSLFFLGFLIWTTWQQDHAPKPVTPTATASNGQVQTSNLNGESVPGNSGVISTASNNVSDDGQDQIVNTSKAAASNAKLVHVKTDILDVYISTSGASIVQVDLLTYPVSLEKKDEPIRILDKNKAYAAQSGLRHINVDGVYRGDLAPNHFETFTVEKTEYILAEGQNDLIVPFKWTNNQGITVTKSFTFKRGNFLVKQTQSIDNQSKNIWAGKEYLQLTHKEHSRTGSLLGGAIAYVGAAYYNNKYEKIDFDDINDGVLADKAKDKLTDAEKEVKYIDGGWIAMLEHYFISSWIPPVENTNTYYTNYLKSKDNYVIGVKTPNKQIAAGTTGTFESQFYVGPTNQGELEKISKGLDLTVDYGIFAFVSKPIFAVMKFINENIVSNWGWTIILLTLFIKLVFFYPSAISYRSMAKMKKLQPKIKSIADKYKNDPQQKQKETMAFYRKEKINPLGGCLPMLIQMPVFMGLYWVLQESVELRQAPWILWYKDLSIQDPTYILPIIMGASMWFQQKLNPSAMQDPMQQKIFSYLPLVFTVMFLFFPAGLVLYWVVNNVLSIFQQWFINKKIIGDG